MLKKISIYLILAMCLMSCEEVLDDVSAGDPPHLLSVESFFSDSLEIQQVKLSWSGDYFAEAFSAGTGAKVSIYEKYSGILVADLQEDSSAIGTYKTSAAIKGVPGTVYQLRVTIEGTNYIAEDSLSHVAKLDRISVAENSFMPSVNSLYMDAVDPINEVNFYMWNIYFDGIMLDDYKNVPFSDDRLISDSIKNISIFDDSFEAKDQKITDKKDTINIRVRQLGISNAAYEYMVGLNAILNKGGMFDSPMAQVQSNVWRVDGNMKPVEMQTGFFMCTGVSEQSIDYFQEKQ